MLKRVSFTISVLTALTGLYLVYSLTVTPWLTPSLGAAPRRAEVGIEELTIDPPAGNMEDAERYLPDVEWAARAKFQIHLSNGVLFSNNWRPIDESRENFEFKPFAMIWFDTPESDAAVAAERKPLTLVADAGLIRFSSKFDPVNEKPGRVILGKMEGDVSIAGPDGMSVRGRDLFFSEESMKLWSDWPIDFTYQRHKGHADHGLQMDLLASTERPEPGQMLRIGGFRNVQLRGPVQMQLHTNSGPLRISCDDRFDFNTESKVASFQINVHAARPTGPNELDSLQFKFLDLLLDDGRPTGRDASPGVGGDAPGVVPSVRSNVGSANESNMPPPSDLDRQNQLNGGRWSIRQVRGSSDQRGKVISQRSGITALMSNLLYDIATRTIRLNDANGVVVRQSQQGWELRCPELTLVQTADGQIETAHGQGRGRLFRQEPDSDEPEFDARWRSHFDWTRVPNSDLDLLELHDRAVIKQPPRGTGLAADAIRVWFDRPQFGSSRSPLAPGADVLSFGATHSSARSPDPRIRLSESAAESDGIARTDSASPRMSANSVGIQSVPDAAAPLRPRQLKATNQVIVVSPQMNAQTESLTVDFEEAPVPGQLASDKQRDAVTPASQRAVAEADAESPPPPEPLQLTASAIRAKVQLLPNGDSLRVSASAAKPSHMTAAVTEIWTEGHVDIQQPQGTDADSLHLSGQRLHMQNAGGDGQIVHLTGQPAIIRDRGLDIEGADLFLDRAKNLTWIEGAGTLRLPVNSDLEGRKLAAPSLLTIWWKERMEFDGLTATFLDDVKAALNDSRLQCDEMEVTLANRISFRGGTASNPQAEVRDVICKNGVELDHSEYVNKELTGIQHGRFVQLHINQKTNRMEGTGPGEVALWRPGRGKRAALAPRATVQANQPIESDTSNWEYTRVTFFGKTLGNIRDRQTTFNDRVRIVYGPVAHPLDTIDPDNLPRDGGEMQCDSLTILQRRDEATAKTWVELKADHNVKLEGRSFHARADSISFDESKELYTLRSAGDRQVTIWRQTAPGRNPDEASGKSIWFIPSQNKLKVNQATGIRGSN